MQNFMELDLKKKSDLKALAFEVWGIKTSLGQFGPKAFSKAVRGNPHLGYIYLNKDIIA